MEKSVQVRPLSCPPIFLRTAFPPENHLVLKTFSTTDTLKQVEYRCLRQGPLFSLERMSFWRALAPIFCCVWLFGCTPQPEAQTDDQKDPFFQLGRRLVTERDFKGAVDAFERALELNPRSVMGHYELGLLYETKMNEPAIALYHYKQVLRLQPNGHPAEIVIARMKGCEQEIAKNVALVQVDPAVMAELERLKEENRRLQRDLETMRALASTAVPVYTNPPPAALTSGSGTKISTPFDSPPTNAVVRTNPTTNHSTRTLGSKNGGSTPSTPSGNSGSSLGQVVTRNSSGSTPLQGSSRAMRTHVVKSRETFSSIARHYGVGVAALRAANPTLSPEKLRAGQMINVPSN